MAMSGITDPNVHSLRLKLYGLNSINVQVKPWFSLLMDEVLHPFYIFQIFSIILWLVDEYVYYAACILFISVVSAIVTLLDTRSNLINIRNLSHFTCQVQVWRFNQWTNVSSETLVPGDVFLVESAICPCDAILLNGECLVNESMLTGESVPVSKVPVTDEDLADLDLDSTNPTQSPKISRFFLYGGTKIIRAKGLRTTGSERLPPSPPGMTQTPVLAVAVRTGFSTEKGALVRSMLFPKANNFKFYRDSFRFIGVLACIACIGFLFSSITFVRLKIAWQVILVRALDLITIVVPPALPATMAIGTGFAISRLKQSNIFCTSPPRVNVCGKVNVICFDKTGTLTQEGLDVLGYKSMMKSIKSGNVALSDLSSDVRIWPKASKTDYTPVSSEGISYPLLLCAMATCHSVKVVHGEMVGDPLDLKMFEFTGFGLRY
jgi:cation-transporting ATPase 13A2